MPVFRFSMLSINSINEPSPPAYDSALHETLETLCDEVQNVEEQVPSTRPPSYAPISPTSPLTPITPPGGDSRPTVHEYHLQDGKGKPWATLTLLSSASSPKRQPRYFEGDQVEGSISLRLDHEESISTIRIIIKGRLIMGTASVDCHPFLDFTRTLWTREMGDPRTHIPGSHSKFHSKLYGEYILPFSFPFPSEVALADDTQPIRLPHTFLERESNGNIQYDLIVRMSRGKLRPESKIQTMVAYIPTTICESPSLLRQRAYLASTPIPGPERDPGGWLTLEPTMIRGQIFNVRPAEVKCTLFLAQPLSYARGTVVPCNILIQSLDAQTLDLLASANAIDIRLRRHVKFYPSNFRTRGKRQSLPTGISIDDMTSAVWTPSPSADGDPPTSRRLDGEIHLAADLQPTSDFPLVTMEYLVVLFPFQVTGFVPTNTQPLLTQPVKITTVRASGPRPLMYITQEARKLEAMRNNSILGTTLLPTYEEFGLFLC